MKTFYLSFGTSFAVFAAIFLPRMYELECQRDNLKNALVTAHDQSIPICVPQDQIPYKVLHVWDDPVYKKRLALVMPLAELITVRNENNEEESQFRYQSGALVVCVSNDVPITALWPISELTYFAETGAFDWSKKPER